jgi:copper oxidase (laccase) domain-containing protein
MAATSNTAMRVGESALTGWRGRVGKAVAKPVADRTRFSEQQIRAFIGFAIIAYGIYRLIRPMVRAARERD